MNRPAATASICFLAGTALAACGIGPASIVELAVVAVLWITWCLIAGGKQARIGGLLLFLLLAGNSWYLAKEEGLISGIEPPVKEWNADTDAAGVLLEGTVASPVEVDGDRAVFYLSADRWLWEGAEETRLSANEERVYVTVRLQSQAEQSMSSEWKRGDRVRLEGQAKIPDTARNFGGFDFREYLRKGNVHWAVTVKGGESVEVLAAEGWTFSRLLGWNDRIRTKAGLRLDKLFPGEEAGYMKGLLIGIREDLEPERFREFSRLGLTHILAISGLHVGVFLWAVTAVCRRLGATRESTMRIAFWATPFYVVFTGSSPSVIRSGITAMVGLLAARKGWLKDGLSLLGLALLGMLAINPHYVTDVGFQLSFLVTAGLLAGVSSVEKLMPFKSKALRGSIAVALTAQLVSFPLSIYYFNQFSLLSLPANLVLVPLISFIVTPLGYIAMLVSFLWPFAGRLLAQAVSWLNQLTFWCVEKTDLLPSARMIWPSPPPWWICAYYGLLITGIWYMGRCHELQVMEKKKIFLTVQGPLLRRRFRTAALVSCGMLLLLLAYGYSPFLITERGTGTVAFLDVGQGDSAWVRTPEGKHLLIDGGGTISFRKSGEEWKERRDPYEVGRKTIVPLLKKRGVHKLDYIVISHEDTDHIGGLPAIMEEIPVGAILFNGTLKPGASAEKLFQTALRLHIPLIPVYEGQVWKVDGSTELAILSPAKQEEEGIQLAEEQNELTVAAMLTMSGRRFLFTGDMGFAQEDELLEKALRPTAGLVKQPDVPEAAVLPQPGPVSVDVLKVAHHGSKNSTSQDWLSYWQPSLSVISAGKNNTYGHPNPLTLERLQDAGTVIYRTDTQGEVQISVTPQGLAVRTRLTAHQENAGQEFSIPSAK
jgi:competence protein ComEC